MDPVGIAIVWAVCVLTPADPVPLSAGRPPNVLLIFADDVGTTEFSSYGAIDPAQTPTLDGLAAQGVRFTRAYANPLCSTSRAALLTGRFSFRTGLLGLSNVPGNSYPLPASEVTLAEVLRAAGYRTGAFGKWHLGGFPSEHGFDQEYFTPSNILDYFKGWPYWVNGQKTPLPNPDGLPHDENYATTVQASDAIQWIETGGGEPWFAYVAFNAAHKPFHVPPSHLIGGAQPSVSATDRALYKWMIEAMDTEIGRLLQAVDLDRTLVLFVADNGFPAEVQPPPYPPYDGGNNKGKLTNYEGGVRVPLIAAGAGVTSSGTCDALVSITDVFMTVAEIAGAPVERIPEDSISLAGFLSDPSAPSIREYAFAEKSSKNGLVPSCKAKGRWSVRNDTHKLIVTYAEYASLDTYELELYDLTLDPTETFDLTNFPLSPADWSQLEELLRTLDRLLATDMDWQGVDENCVCAGGG